MNKPRLNAEGSANSLKCEDNSRPISSGKGRNSEIPAKNTNESNGIGCSTPSETLEKHLGTTGTSGLTLEQLADAKRIPLADFQSWGVEKARRPGPPSVAIPYMAEDCSMAARRYRLSLNGSQQFLWRNGGRPTLYGLWQLPGFRGKGWCLLVEGESDSWTCWLHDVPALGIPGKNTWRAEWAEPLAGMEVFLWQEPDAPDLPEKVAGSLPELKVIRAPSGIKDLSEAYLQGHDIETLVKGLKAQAISFQNLKQAELVAQIRVLGEQAEKVLACPDPLVLVHQEIVRLGYGSDPTPALVTYLALTSRLLAMRPGAMPFHLLLFGPASAGKSYTLKSALRLLPEMAYHTIEAGSPRVLIYDDADLQHRAVIFGEADSLPAGEDNPAASAIRNLLQDHHLHYDVTVRDKETGKYRAHRVNKLGPTVLITTSTKQLGHQLDTRLFILEVSDHADHIRSALNTQASLELKGPSEVDLSLVAFQEYLQFHTPWEVVVPFAEELAEEMGKRIIAPRTMRDFARLISLIKTVAILRHEHRKRDAKSRLVAQVEDYATVFELISPMYESTTGVSEAIRGVVQAVGQLGEGVCQADIAKHLNISRSSASHRVRSALKSGWLINTAPREGQGQAMSLKIGDPLPERSVLPNPCLFNLPSVVTGDFKEGGAGQYIETIREDSTPFTVQPQTEDQPYHDDELLEGRV